jgi:SAM-dependent methyltransferase
VTGEFITDGHLGGYVAGGDPDCMYPEMWAWLVERERIEGVLDVGCGDGAALAAFRALGCVVLGIDGVPQDDEDIVEHDFTAGPWKDSDSYDLVWSCEFVEHVERRYIENFLPAFQQAPLVLMTHATPGQPGWHHVNCQDSTWWQGIMLEIGYRVDENLTAETRQRAHGYYAATGLAFRRRP